MIRATGTTSWRGEGHLLGEQQPFLEIFDELDTTREIRELWCWLLKYGDAHLQPLARAAHAEPALRRLLPFVSHGCLSLLQGRVGRQTQAASSTATAGTPPHVP